MTAAKMSVSPCATAAPASRTNSRPQVFDKFTQADNAGGQAKGGTGLGLSIAREIVTRMNGQIGFDDAAGGGTVFYIDLPQADHAEQLACGPRGWSKSCDVRRCDTAGVLTRRQLNDTPSLLPCAQTTRQCREASSPLTFS